MIITANSFGQETCWNATNINSLDTLFQLSSNDTVSWFVYNANTPNLMIQLINGEKESPYAYVISNFAPPDFRNRKSPVV